MPSPTLSTPIRSQTPVQTPALKVKTHVKAGNWGIPMNHNETLVRVPGLVPGLQVKTRIKARR